MDGINNESVLKTGFEEREAMIKEKEEMLSRRESEIAKSEAELDEKLSKLGLRGKLYSNINVSLRTMDIIIGVLTVILAASIIVGVAQGIG